MKTAGRLSLSIKADPRSGGTAAGRVQFGKTRPGSPLFPERPLNSSLLQNVIVMPTGKGRVTVSFPESELSLTFAEGDCAGRTSLVLSKSSTIIGRGEECDVVLDGETVSRHHCSLIRWGTLFMIEDTSRNGTFLNGQRIQQAQLKHGDQIRIGKNILIVSLTSSMGTRVFKSRVTTRLENNSSSGAIKLPHIVVKGLEAGVTQPFSDSSITIGRRVDCHVVLEGDNVSCTHTAITRRDDGYYVIDLESSNGTYCNEQRVDKQLLHDGDRLRIGSYTLAVTLRGLDCILNFKKNTK